MPLEAKRKDTLMQHEASLVRSASNRKQAIDSLNGFYNLANNLANAANQVANQVDNARRENESAEETHRKALSEENNDMVP
mmetsp:Transcript_18037/g.26695  ORF Transcript_18037/g.26695 Transcript_18037/m.26695 type:complete len:81 (+) Transcript_18037:162-404(+)